MPDKLEGQYRPTVMQSAMGEPLRSEQRTGEFLPRVLSRVDMVVLFIAIVLFIPNASIVQGAGGATYIYWIIGTLTFLIPGALVSGQLNRFMPTNGGVYVWTHRACGPLLGFFAGFCAWFPGILALLVTEDIIVSLIQGIGTQISGSQAHWLSMPWQQGLVALAIVPLVAWLSTWSLTRFMRMARIIILFYSLAIALVGLAGVVWLLQGHAPQGQLTSSSPGFNGPHIMLYGVIVLALLGVEVPLNMAAEMKQRRNAALFLRWGPLLVLAAYLLGTFGVMVVVPADSAGTCFSTLTAISRVFGPAITVLTAVIFITFFVAAAVIYNITFARILFAAALDHRMPPSLAKVNRRATPHRTTAVQAIIVLVLLLHTYFIVPLLNPSGMQNIALTTQVYDVTQASTTVIWCVSMVFLFLDLPILLVRFRRVLAMHPDQLIAPIWLLWLSCIVGGATSLLGIYTTMTKSWNSSLFSDIAWVQFVGITTLASLFIGLFSAAYPRLLTSLNKQTEEARENARLYNELRIAYDKLSEIDALKDAFLTTASHELRTPLTIVQGYLELLGEMDHQADAELRRSFLDKARRACEELVLLQANIMDASRIHLDAASLHCAPLHLKELCSTVLMLFEPLILQQSRTVTMDVPSSVLVMADETCLKQVLRNLIANALRYSPPSAPIRILADIEQESCKASIRVVDHGPGIPPDKLEAIFDKFVRLERDMHGVNRGSGLGLYITKQLVEAMKGTIMVESKGIPGEGATFLFTLPMALTVASPTGAQIRALPPPQD